MQAALSSANSEGACPACNGAGVIYMDLEIMAGVTTVCEECQARRYQASLSLKYRLGDKNIAEVLDLPVKDAALFFGPGDAAASGKSPNTSASQRLPRMSSCSAWPTSASALCVWPSLLTTLSGGERQRLKLATHIAEEVGVDVLDELTTGLHLADLATARRCSIASSTGQIRHRDRAPPVSDGAR